VEAPTGNASDADAAEFNRLRDALWPKSQNGTHRYGTGTVFFDGARAGLEALGVVQDFESSVKGVDYIHRRTGDTDVYFVRNGAGEAMDFAATFRASGRTPEVWDAVSGRVASEVRYVTEGGRTKLPLHLDPYGSAIVVFAQPEDVKVARVSRDGAEVDGRVERDQEGALSLRDAPAGSYSLELSNGKADRVDVLPVGRREIPVAQWKISYQSGRGAPTGERALTGFRSWTESRIPGIRYFSGTATYSTTIAMHAKPGQHVALRMTDVHEVCTVRVNGKEAGTLWAMPYVLDITGFLQDGDNQVELAVTNLWPNRIIGDAQPSAREHYTKTNITKYKADSPLLPSGLIGPVMLEMDQMDASANPR
jgi:hypothetical protein